jgi:hypothetical protein
VTRDEPRVNLRYPNDRSSDPRKGVGSSRQQGGGHGSRQPIISRVTTYLPNDPAPKMDDAQTIYP